MEKEELEEFIEEKVEKEVEQRIGETTGAVQAEGSASYIDRLVEEKIQQRFEGRSKKPESEESRISRRNFLKSLGLGAGALAFASQAAAGFGLLKQPSDTSHDTLMDVTSGDHHSRPSAGTLLTENSGSFDVQEGSISHDSIADVSSADHHSKTTEGDLTGGTNIDTSGGSIDVSPQGSGSSLNADTVDGNEASELGANGGYWGPIATLSNVIDGFYSGPNNNNPTTTDTLTARITTNSSGNVDRYIGGGSEKARIHIELTSVNSASVSGTMKLKDDNGGRTVYSNNVDASTGATQSWVVQAGTYNPSGVRKMYNGGWTCAFKIQSITANANIDYASVTMDINSLSAKI